MRRALTATGKDEDRVLGEYTSGAAIDDVDDTFVHRFLFAFWRLCEQQIADIQIPDVTHTARLIAERAGVDPDVRVVQLRRTTTSNDQAPSQREWQHQWVVRMHKVRQWYPSLQRHKVIYRGPYLKGPQDKPLLGGDTVTALTR